MSSELPPKVVHKILKELRSLQGEPCEGIRVYPNEHNITDVQAEIDGPAGTPYEGGVFRLKLILSSGFPETPPKGLFLTRIFHPNVSKSGDVCVNVLKKDWNPDVGLRHVLMVIRCLLIQPFPESALNEEAGMLLMEQYEEYAKHARLMTSIHAQPAKRPMPLTTRCNLSNADSATATQSQAQDVGAPVLKKPKADKKSASDQLSRAKKSLKRL